MDRRTHIQFEVGIEFLFGDLRNSLSSMGELARQPNTCSVYENTSKKDALRTNYVV
jgi:hypothetical protein